MKSVKYIFGKKGRKISRWCDMYTCPCVSIKKIQKFKSRSSRIHHVLGGIRMALICGYCLPSWLLGGNTSLDDNPKHDGDDGTSFLGPEGEPFLPYPLKGNVFKSQMNGSAVNTQCCFINLSCWLRCTSFICAPEFASNVRLHIDTRAH